METDENKLLAEESHETPSTAIAFDPPPALRKVEESSEIVEEPSRNQDCSEKDLTLEVPIRTMESTTEEYVNLNIPTSPSAKRVNFSPLPSPSYFKSYGSPGPSSSRGKPSIRSLLPRLSSKFRNTSSDIEKAAMLALAASPGSQDKTLITRTFSLSKILAPKMSRTSSLPVTPIAHSTPESAHGGNMSNLQNSTNGGTKLFIHRSLSVPVLNKDGSERQIDYLGGVFRVIPATPQGTEKNGATLDANPTADADKSEAGGEDIPQEEAVCRICLVELGEGSDTLKMECSCKGELALAHQECAVKWFSIKGNKTCDVCKQEVRNLPVTLLRIQSVQNTGSGSRQGEVRFRVWQDVPILVIVSMLAYFCFLEQLLVTKMGSGAIAISLPFSCILGLLASMTSTTMVRRRYAWIYATMQFVLVVLFAHVFYLLLHVQAVLSVLLASFAGFGGAMCGTSIFFEILNCRERWHDRSSQQSNPEDVVQPNQSATDHTTQIVQLQGDPANSGNSRGS